MWIWYNVWRIKYVFICHIVIFNFYVILKNIWIVKNFALFHSKQKFNCIINLLQCIEQSYPKGSATSNQQRFKNKQQTNHDRAFKMRFVCMYYEYVLLILVVFSQTGRGFEQKFMFSGFFKLFYFIYICHKFYWATTDAWLKKF